MAILVSSLLTVLAAGVGILVAIFFLEIAAATLLPQGARMPPRGRAPRPRIAVLVPAHNESTQILPTLGDIKSQLRSGDRLLVVADNCSDNTAEVAARAGVEVSVRTDPARRGKGYALDCGISHLATDPPEVVVIIDADCRLSDQCLECLATTCAAARRPVQALDLMTAPTSSTTQYSIGEFAWRVKNWVRPLGLRALKLPCQLVGTGMAFPWETIRYVDLANGLLMEDVKLGLDFALSGKAPIFCPSAAVTSFFPATREGSKTQRQRWEHGHLGLILTTVPRALYSALRTANFSLLALALDIAVPPLSLLLGLLCITLATTAFASVLGIAWMPLIISLGSATLFAAAGVLAWWTHGRDLLKPSALISVAGYAAAKLPLYYQFLSRRAPSQWIRTDRSPSE
jgi:cellulose synthase/poly-beta-1,6-N-acetylglucosamine synthase-like glycosyltransferase